MVLAAFVPSLVSVSVHASYSSESICSNLTMTAPSVAPVVSRDNVSVPSWPALPYRCDRLSGPVNPLTRNVLSLVLDRFRPAFITGCRTTHSIQRCSKTDNGRRTLPSTLLLPSTARLPSPHNHLNIVAVVLVGRGRLHGRHTHNRLGCDANGGICALWEIMPSQQQVLVRRFCAPKPSSMVS